MPSFICTTCGGGYAPSAGAYAYVHSAMDQAGRAIDELLGGGAITGYATFPGPDIEVVGQGQAIATER